jgi:hypothetical protein
MQTTTVIIKAQGQNKETTRKHRQIYQPTLRRLENEFLKISVHLETALTAGTQLAL